MLLSASFCERSQTKFEQKLLLPVLSQPLLRKVSWLPLFIYHRALSSSKVLHHLNIIIKLIVITKITIMIREVLATTSINQMVLMMTLRTVMMVMIIIMMATTFTIIVNKFKQKLKTSFTQPPITHNYLALTTLNLTCFTK